VRRNCIVGLPQQKSAAECTRFFARSKSCARANTFNFVHYRLATSTANLADAEDEEEGQHLATIN
jgi:hypothetical protein